MSIFALQFALLHPKSVVKMTKCDFSLSEATILDPNFHNFDGLSWHQESNPSHFALCSGNKKGLTWYLMAWKIQANLQNISNSLSTTFGVKSQYLFHFHVSRRQSFGGFFSSKAGPGCQCVKYIWRQNDKKHRLNTQPCILALLFVFFQEACKTLLKRMEPVIQRNPGGKWEDWVRTQNITHAWESFFFNCREKDKLCQLCFSGVDSVHWMHQFVRHRVLQVRQGTLKIIQHRYCRSAPADFTHKGGGRSLWHRARTNHIALFFSFFLFFFGSCMSRKNCFFTCRIPNVGFDFNTGTGRPFHYFSYGAAVSEVEIDCLTGDHTVNEFNFQATLRCTKERPFLCPVVAVQTWAGEKKNPNELLHLQFVLEKFHKSDPLSVICVFPCQNK